jgi:hypothetical protein
MNSRVKGASVVLTVRRGVAVMSAKQLVIVILAVVLIAVAFAAKQVFLSGHGTTDDKPPPPTDKSPLIIVSDASGPRYEEAFTAGHHAFRFRNKRTEPVHVGINWKNCKCAGVEICLAPDGWKLLDEAELAKRVEDSSLDWQELQKDGSGFTIPPEAIGWIRIGWRGDKGIGDQQFSADLWLFDPESGIGHNLSVPVSFVEAVRVRAEDNDTMPDAFAGRMNAGEHATVKFLFFSSTRKQFTLQPDTTRKDPLLMYGEATPLSKEDLEKYAKMHERRYLCAYRCSVTVHEQAGGAQLDIGPFHRRVAWKSDATKMPIESHINGVVLGEVVVVSGEKGDPRVDMGAINPRRPAPFDFVLESDNPQVELTLDKERTVDFLKVETPDGPAGKVIAPGSPRRSWTVTISFDPQSEFRGMFPDKERTGYESTGVVFKITHAGVKGGQERRIKVLVRGQVRPD